jgi:hypothetical protein
MKILTTKKQQNRKAHNKTSTHNGAKKVPTKTFNNLLCPRHVSWVITRKGCAYQGITTTWFHFGQHDMAPHFLGPNGISKTPVSLAKLHEEMLKTYKEANLPVKDQVVYSMLVSGEAVVTDSSMAVLTGVFTGHRQVLTFAHGRSLAEIFITCPRALYGDCTIDVRMCAIKSVFMDELHETDVESACFPLTTTRYPTSWRFKYTCPTMSDNAVPKQFHSALATTATASSNLFVRGVSCSQTTLFSIGALQVTVYPDKVKYFDPPVSLKELRPHQGNNGDVLRITCFTGKAVPFPPVGVGEEKKE